MKKKITIITGIFVVLIVSISFFIPQTQNKLTLKIKGVPCSNHKIVSLTTNKEYLLDKNGSYTFTDFEDEGNMFSMKDMGINNPLHLKLPFDGEIIIDYDGKSTTKSTTINKFFFFKHSSSQTVNYGKNGK